MRLNQFRHPTAFEPTPPSARGHSARAHVHNHASADSILLTPDFFQHVPALHASRFVQLTVRPCDAPHAIAAWVSFQQLGAWNPSLRGGTEEILLRIAQYYDVPLVSFKNAMLAEARGAPPGS